MKKAFNLLKILSINLIIFSFLIIIIDLFMDKPSQSLSKRSIILRDLGVNIDTENQPDKTYLSRCDGLEDKTYRLRTDKDGFILGEKNINSNIDLADIIFFGGSTTECLYVEESKRFPYLVQEKINNLSGNSITTLNGGVSGNNSVHSTLNLLAKGINRNPKIVILMHNINDFSGLEKTGSYYNQPVGRSIVQEQYSPSSSAIKRRAKSLKNALIPNIFKAYSNLKTKPKLDEWKGFRKSDTIPFLQIKNEFTKSITTFINTARSHNIKVILMTQFNRVNMNDNFIQSTNEIDKVFVNRYHKMNETIKEIARKEQVGLIDLAQKIPSNNKYIYDPVHLNTKGSELAAEIITEYIINNNYLN